MIKLEPAKMTKAIERAKAIRPRVRVISASERKYAVYGSRGDAYTVRFVVANGHKLGECNCPARGICYHIACAAHCPFISFTLTSRTSERAMTSVTPMIWTRDLNAIAQAMARG